MKKVIVISTSLRAGSNSDMLADKFMEGALQAGHEVEKISLIGKDIRFCRGCLACQKLGKCVIQDDVDAIMQKVLHADVIVWATPIYYFEMSGQMKVLIDRMNALYTLDYQFRDVYMLTVAAEEEPEVPQRAEAGLTGWIDCFPKSRLAGTLFCGGVADPRAISGHSYACLQCSRHTKFPHPYLSGCGTCRTTRNRAGTSKLQSHTPCELPG